MKRSNLRTQRPRTTRRISGRAQQDHILDPYQRQQKLHEGTACPQCGAVYHQGRWRWVTKAEGAGEELCAACRRINDKFPAGVVTLRGDFAREDKQELIHLARHQEEAEKRERRIFRAGNLDQGGLKRGSPGTARRALEGRGVKFIVLGTSGEIEKRIAVALTPRDCCHLAKIRQRRLAAIRLPIDA